jgi:hypothetical protein
MNGDNWEHYYTLHQDKMREQQRQLEQQRQIAQQLEQQRINAERDERFNSLRPASAIKPPDWYVPGSYRGGKRTRQKKRRSKKTRSKK